MHKSFIEECGFTGSLDPRTVMGRNELCWCRSGKKWKKCHRDRHLQQEIPQGKLAHELINILKHGMCLHPEASNSTCSSGTIKAHTIQKAGGLSAIADDGHVISVKVAFERITRTQGEVIPAPIGIKNASTFMGFCSYHDNSMFEPIENNSFTLNQEAAFLLAFRALTYEYQMKKNAVRSIEILRESDRGKTFQEQVFIQSELHERIKGTMKGVSDGRKWKSQYDEMYLNSDFGSMPHYSIEFDGKLPFVCSGGFHPEVDFNGKRLQSLSQQNVDFEHVCLNVSVLGGKTFLAFGWYGSEGGPAERFVKSFKSIKTTGKANAALILAVEQLENIYFNPSWWNGLSDISKNHLIERMKSGLRSYSTRSEATFINLAEIITDIDVINETGTI